MAEREWLDSLKAGDVVAIRGASSRDVFEAAVIVKRDKVKILANSSRGGGAERFSAKSGVASDSYGYFRRSLCELTPAKKEAIHREALTQRIRNNVEWHKLPTATLEAVAAALDAANSSQRAVQDSQGGGATE